MIATSRQGAVDMQRMLNSATLGGAILLTLGLFVAWYAQQNYAFGTMRRMGPGFLPRILGWTLAGLGGLILIAGLFGADARKGATQRVDIMGAGFVLGGIVAFGLMLPVLGVVLTSLLTVLIVLVPDRNFTTMAKLATAACVAAVTWAVFILGLGMNLQVWPAFL